AAVLRARPAAATASAAEQHDPIAANLGRVFVLTVLVLPLPRLQPPLDVNLFALRQVLVEALRGFAPEDDAVPFGLFLFLAALVVPDFGRRQIQRRDGGTARREAHLRIPPEITDE